jgi:hypothetical protein
MKKSDKDLTSEKAKALTAQVSDSIPMSAAVIHPMIFVAAIPPVVVRQWDET